MWLFAVFIAVPLIEIALFIKVGGAIGLWPTLAIVIGTAALGTTLMRSQGAKALADIQSSLNDLRDPSEQMAHGAMILFAGALLLTPGFFTDAMGLALLVPGVRRAILRWLRARMNVTVMTAGMEFGMGHGPRSQPDDVIDGDFSDVTPRPGSDGRLGGPDGPSGWTRH